MEADVMGMKALRVKADHVEPQRLSSPSIVSGTPFAGFSALMLKRLRAGGWR